MTQAGLDGTTLQRVGGPDSVWVAGETSGDLLAAVILKAWSNRHPGVCAAGIGGPALKACGLEAWWPSDRLAVRGYVEVLRHYRDIVGIRQSLQERVLAQPPRVFVGVDAPDFNLKLEESLRRQGVPTVHLVCPSIWAWRPERIHQLRRSADHVLCIFPFEPALLQAQGIPCTYIGHPLAPCIPMVPDREAARARLGVRGQGPVIALLPGSRRSEIHALLPRFLAAAAHILRRRPDAQLLLPMAPGLAGLVRELVSRHAPALPVSLVDGQSHACLAACDVTLIASGTATLEAALFKRPMVIAYHMNAISWWLMRGKRLQPWVGLPNILCASSLVPERLQGDATPECLAADVLSWLDRPKAVESLQLRFADLHRELTRNTAELACDVLDGVARLSSSHSDKPSRQCTGSLKS
jgi:lipid-A-disaccharide synthase